MDKLFGLFEIDKTNDTFWWNTNGKPEIDITNGVERYFWDMSKDDLEQFISFTKTNEELKVFYDVARKVRSQREFMKSNRELRKALVPNVRR